MLCAGSFIEDSRARIRMALFWNVLFSVVVVVDSPSHPKCVRKRYQTNNRDNYFVFVLKNSHTILIKDLRVSGNSLLQFCALLSVNG